MHVHACMYSHACKRSCSCGREGESKKKELGMEIKDKRRIEEKIHQMVECVKIKEREGHTLSTCMHSLTGA